MTPGFVVGAVEVALNRYLRLEPDAIAECARLAPRLIQLQVRQPDWTLVVEFTATGVRVLGEPPKRADVTVRAPLGAFLKLGAASARGDSGLPAGIEVEGDAELLTRFNRLIASVGFDLAELLSKFVDDGAAQRLAEGIKDLLGWGRDAADTLLVDGAEYLREETRDLARASDVADWAEAVDVLRERTDRLEARLALLEKRA